MPVFVKGQNPAVSLFNFWDEFVPQSQYPRRCRWQKWGITEDDATTRTGWGSRGWALSRINTVRHDVSAETGIIYGKWYRDIYTSFVLLPDGRFGLRYVHGYDNRTSLASATFLHYDRVASRDRWSVNPYLGWKGYLRDNELDRQGHVPKLLTQTHGFDLLWELRYDVQDREHASQGWRITLAGNQHTDLRQEPVKEGVIEHAKGWLEVEERRALKRIDYRENPRPHRVRKPWEPPDIPALASGIVAFLNVSEPANNVPHPKVRRLQEAAHE